MNNLPSVLPETVGISSDVLLLVMKKLSELKYVNSIVILRHGRSTAARNFCCISVISPTNLRLHRN